MLVVMLGKKSCIEGHASCTAWDVPTLLFGRLKPRCRGLGYLPLGDDHDEHVPRSMFHRRHMLFHANVVDLVILHSEIPTAAFDRLDDRQSRAPDNITVKFGPMH
jgi:hypothetical protein